jgi:hypothetical protein
MNSKIILILRWITFLPCGLLASVLGWYAINIIGEILLNLGWVPIDTDSFISKVYFISVGHGISGLIFVYIGAIVAPSKRVLVAIILCFIGIILSGGLIIPAIKIQDWWSVWGGIYMALGSGAGVWLIYLSKFWHLHKDYL